MKPGKLSAADLRSLIFPRRGARREDVLVRAGIGQDSAVVAFGDEVAVLSTDPITGAGSDAGWLAVLVGCNDVAAAGAQPIGVLVTLLLAPATALDDARRIMGDAHRAAEELGVEIIGGHSEITADLVRSIVVVTALGRARTGTAVTAAGARPGDAILMTKWAGLEGTAILARDFADALRARLAEDVLARAQSLIGRISIVSEALAAATAGVSAMHDVTEGGVIGALAELTEACHHGVYANLDRVPVLPETTAICSVFGINPFLLVSSGALLITTPTPIAVLVALTAIGCPAALIGHVVEGPSIVHQNGQARPLVAPERDALWEAIERGPTRPGE